MEVLLVRVATRTLNPYGDGVRTMGEGISAFRTGGRRTGAQTLEVLPAVTQRVVTRAGLRDTCRTDRLVLRHDTVTAATGLAVSEVKLK